MKTTLLISITITTLLSGCNSIDYAPVDGAGGDSFISAYIIPERLEAMPFSKDGDTRIKFAFKSTKHFTVGEEFNRRADLIGDWGYGKSVPYNRVSFAYPLIHVEITSDHDFDPTHPAGSSLADIAILETCDYLTVHHHYNAPQTPDIVLTPLHKFPSKGLSYFMNDHSPYYSEPPYGTDDGVKMRFNSKPARTSEHNLTISFTFADHTSVETTVATSFE